jgi:amino acid adenylation domain-containing protein
LLQHPLLASARRSPDAIAVSCRDDRLTYAELDRASDAFARRLQEGGIMPGDRVAVMLPKRVELLIAVYGILKAGAVFVPIDPTGPSSRAAGVGADCAIAGLVATAELAGDVLGEPGAPSPGIVIVDIGRTGTADSRPDADRIDVDLACLMYTSGSTGVPKGVMHSHRSVLRLVESWSEAIGLTAEDRLLNSTPLHFVPSLLTLFSAALTGSSVTLVPDEATMFGPDLRALLLGERITVWIAPPVPITSVMRTTAGPGEFPDLRTMMWAGAVFPTRQVRELRRSFPATRLIHASGSTETVLRTMFDVEQVPNEDDHVIPIGTALPNSEVFALRDDGSIARLDEEAEMYVRGAAVFRGYWGDPELTARVLVSDPRGTGLPDLVHRTGDMVRPVAHGGYVFVGRRDHMVKSRGFRIELGDIEAVLTTHPLVEEAVAVAVPHPEWGSLVSARVVPGEGAGLTEGALKAHCADRLPPYMIPVRIEVVPALPRTSTGKVDRMEILEELTASQRLPTSP